MPQALQKVRNKDWLDSYTFRIKCPEGTAWVQIFESDVGKIEKVVMTVGKAGSAVNALCAGITELVTKNLKRGDSISEIIMNLSGITSDKSIRTNGTEVRSPIDALIIALIRYRAAIPSELEEESLGRHLRVKR